jgi:hypothetical protein
MRLRRPSQILILTLATLAAAGCSSVEPQRQLISGRAVVIYAADREADAQDAESRLTAIGLAVDTEREGPPVRTRSSVAVYRVAREEQILEPVEAALAGFPDIEWLPFVHSGPPNTDVVVWLVSQDRDEAAREAAEAEIEAAEPDSAE